MEKSNAAMMMRPHYVPTKLTTDEFLLHRSFYEKERVSKLRICNDPNRGLTKCLVCAEPSSREQITYRCDHCLRLFHPKCWDIPAVPTRLWFCSLKCEEHMLLAGTMSTCLPGVNEHLSVTAVPAEELKQTLLRKRRLENPTNPSAKRGKGGGSPSSGDGYDEGDDDSIKTNSSKDGDENEGCAMSVKELIARYTTSEVPCYLCGVRGCQGHSPEEVRDKLFARRTRAKRLKQLRTQCIQQVQRQRQLREEQSKKARNHRYRLPPNGMKRHPDPDSNIRQRTEEGIIDLCKMFETFQNDMQPAQQSRMAYDVRIRVTKMVEDVLKEYKSKIELQFQNTYRKQTKNMTNMPLYQQKLQFGQMAKQPFPNGMITYGPGQITQQYLRQPNGYRNQENTSRSPDNVTLVENILYQRARQRTERSSDRPRIPRTLPHQRVTRPKSVPFTNTPSPSMSPETQTRPPSSRSYTRDSSKRRSRNSRDTKPIIPMLPTASHKEHENETESRGPPTSLRENSHEVEASYLSMNVNSVKSRFNELDYNNLNASATESKSDASRLDVWGSSPLPLPPSNTAQTDANLLAHNVENNSVAHNPDLLQGMTSAFPSEPSSFEIQNGRDLLKN